MIVRESIDGLIRRIIFILLLMAGGKLFSQSSVQPADFSGPAPSTEQATNSIQKPPLPDLPQLPSAQNPDASSGVNQVSPTAAEQVSPSANDYTLSKSTDKAIGFGGNINIQDLPALDAPVTVLSPISVPQEAANRTWRFAPIAGLGYVYDDNIYITHTNPTATSIYQLTGGIRFEAGDYREHKNDFLSLNYLGTGLIYPDLPQLNGYNQNATLNAHHIWSKLMVDLESLFAYLTGPNRDVGSFTRGTTFNNTLKFLYQHSKKTSFDLEFNQRSYIYPQNLSSYYQEVRLGTDYQLNEKFKAGLQAIIGENTAQQSPNQTYQTLSARTDYNLTGKLKLKAAAGVQANEFTTGNIPARMVPVFSFESDYLLTPSTTLGLLAYRNLQNSASLTGQDYIATGFSLKVIQTIHHHWKPGITLSYENDTYIANSAGVSTSRVDNFLSFKPQISYLFLKHLEGDIYYDFRKNASTEQNYSWNDNQFGVEFKTEF